MIAWGIVVALVLVLAVVTRNARRAQQEAEAAREELAKTREHLLAAQRAFEAAAGPDGLIRVTRLHGGYGLDVKPATREIAVSVLCGHGAP